MNWSYRYSMEDHVRFFSNFSFGTIDQTIDEAIIGAVARCNQEQQGFEFIEIHLSDNPRVGK